MRFLLLKLSLAGFPLMSCVPRDFNGERATTLSTNQENITQAAFPDFCSAPKEEERLWNAQRVQNEITKLIEDKDFKSSGLSTYAEAYLAMTHARDQARCSVHDKMAPKTPLARKLNDTLADLMTKGLVESQKICFQQILGKDVIVPELGKQLCQVSHQAIKERWSALEYAMASTAIYLSSLMGIALSALPHIEPLWAGTPHKSLDDRLTAMGEFRQTYDAFNLFLSNNLHTVAQVLVREKRVNCKIFELAARSAEITRAPALLFQEIRNQTFALGLQLSQQWPKGLHPLTAGESYWNINREFGTFAKEPAALVALKQHGLKTVVLLKNPLLKIFKGENIAHFITFEGLTCPTNE